MGKCEAFHKGSHRKLVCFLANWWVALVCLRRKAACLGARSSLKLGLPWAMHFIYKLFFHFLCKNYFYIKLLLLFYIFLLLLFTLLALQLHCPLLPPWVWECCTGLRVRNARFHNFGGQNSWLLNNQLLALPFWLTLLSVSPHKTPAASCFDTWRLVFLPPCGCVQMGLASAVCSGM